MRFRTIAAAVAVMLTLLPAYAPAQLTARGPISFGPSAAGESVKYLILMDFKVSNGAGPPAGQPQEVLFTLVDPRHMQLSTGQGAAAETATFDRGGDGRIHAKLKRGSLLYWPMQIFNKLQSVTSVASQIDPGEVRSGPIPLWESDDAIPGALRLVASTAGATDVTIEAAGPAAPRDIPRGVADSKPAPPDDSGKTGGLGSGQQQQKPKQSGPVEGDATSRLRAIYTGGVLTRAEGIEQIVIAGSPTVTITRHWTLAKA
jgi:hypothetical protein